MKKVIAIIGPTASGKSNFAEELAVKFNGAIINADSLQLYNHLRVLTARPTDNDVIPHKLYGVLHGDERANLAWWYREAVREIETAISNDLLPIAVGGTGMYLQALEKGIANIPNIPDELRKSLRDRYENASNTEIHSLLAELDPDAATRFNPSDKQRIMRALEVKIHTGKSILAWQTENTKLAELAITWIVLQPDRQILYKRINSRFINMIDNGAIDEVKALVKMQLPQDHQIMKAVGVKELSAYLDGNMGLPEAITKAQQESRRYAKRQFTWIRNQIIPDLLISDIDPLMRAWDIVLRLN